MFLPTPFFSTNFLSFFLLFSQAFLVHYAKLTPHLIVKSLFFLIALCKLCSLKFNSNMEYPYLTFHISGQVAINLADNYSDVTDQDLEILLSQCRETLSSVQEEIRRRNPSQTGEDEGYCERLRKTADNLNVLERLNDRGRKHVDTAIQTLASPPKSKSVKIYKDFLHDIQRHCSPGILLICAVGLGKQRIANMTENDRIQLLRHVKDQRSSLSFPILENLARCCNLPEKESPSPALRSMTYADTSRR